MTPRRIVTLLAAATFGALTCPAVAQTLPAAGASPAAPAAGDARAAPAPAAKPRAKPGAHAKAKADAKADAAPGAGAPHAPGAETEAASLERRRRAFFAAPPDEVHPDEPGAPAGVTLGGSNGLTPGMGFKF